VESGFVQVVQKYTPANGSLSEQYNRTSGEPLSAWDLTWCFASFVSMTQRRNGQYPASWLSNTSGPIPSTCEATSAMGTYAAATAAGAPPVSTACTVQVTFAVNASTTFGQNVYISGNVSALGNCMCTQNRCYSAIILIYYRDTWLRANGTRTVP